MGSPGPGVSAQVAIRVGAAKGYQTQAAVHRWVAADVYRYDLSLSDEAIGSRVASTSIRAQASPAEVVFANLHPGSRYQVAIVAMGNIGANPSLPLQILNSQTPSTVELDLSGTQNLEDQLSATASVTLDSTPFAGNLTVVVDPPAGTATLSAELVDARDPDKALYTQTFASGPQGVTFRNLAVGIPYQALLTAHSGTSAGEVATASSVSYLFDPEQNDLETDATTDLGTWSAWH
ncbi:MAG: hypothetical protein KGR26_01570 [Cyanobacteria bacterium REEB65]|nr:hypothetical protein [Cyanobacteria bacterium REEB65]